MGINGLKYLRLIIPGILMILLILLVNKVNIKNIQDVFTNIQAENTCYTIAIVFIGVLYYIFHIRYVLWKPFNERIQNNIKNRLLKRYGKHLNQEQIVELKKGRKLMNIFYQIIDNDKSLTEKANRVRFNGLIWTSMMDIAIISFIGSIIFWIKYFFETENNNSIFAWCLLAATIIFIGLTEISTRKHLSLSNEQLDMICQLHKQELCRLIDETMQT